MSIGIDEKMVDRWRAAVRETHERRWHGKGSILQRAGILLSLFGFATLSLLALLALTHAL